MTSVVAVVSIMISCASIVMSLISLRINLANRRRLREQNMASVTRLYD